MLVAVWKGSVAPSSILGFRCFCTLPNVQLNTYAIHAVSLAKWLAFTDSLAWICIFQLSKVGSRPSVRIGRSGILVDFLELSGLVPDLSRACTMLSVSIVIVCSVDRVSGSVQASLASAARSRAVSLSISACASAVDTKVSIRSPDIVSALLAVALPVGLRRGILGPLKHTGVYCDIAGSS